MKRLYSLGLAIGLALAASAAAPALAQQPADPVSGTWSGDWGPSPGDRNSVSVELKTDGKAVTGTVNPGPNAVTIQKGTFDSKTKAVHFEADVKGQSGANIHYVVDGKLDGKTMIGSWKHDNNKGDFKISKK
jgi:uncharacterized protein (DUF2147 family)